MLGKKKYKSTLKPSEEIIKLVEKKGGKITSRQVESILFFLDCQHESMTAMLDIIDERFNLLDKIIYGKENSKKIGKEANQKK